MTNPESIAQILSLETIKSISEDISQICHAKDYQKIGFGQCGLIFHKRVNDTVAKVARPHFHDSLYADCLAHKAVQAAFEAQEKAPACRLPKLHAHHDATSTWWVDNKALLAEQHPAFPLPSSALVSDHFPPLSKAVREELITRYCPKIKYTDVVEDPLNQHCLARIYLGRRRAPHKPLQINFSLRNFNLHLDQMIEMRLPVDRYAAIIGEALAILHWSAYVDAYDVEFVLGSEVVNETEITTRIWVLDFNLCSRFDKETAIQHPAEVIDQLVISFFENDPYYPRPGCDGEIERQVWDAFKTAYISTAEGMCSQANTDATLSELPQKFIDECIERCGKDFAISH
ncbi:hypothetical protein FHETE_7219 [Fusarium heterosporum]|uniref:DUF3669 domain-containing protein n=1 Tax=Fusarium heterosporum TaxID=42747 RepID=A0A8H5T7L5_FUSHE|nr:hypothetical protein FHETE_7219 [Fusarium heterosporum]